jgi:hypothetical protein
MAPTYRYFSFFLKLFPSEGGTVVLKCTSTNLTKETEATNCHVVPCGAAISQSKLSIRTSRTSTHFKQERMPRSICSIRLKMQLLTVPLVWQVALVTFGATGVAVATTLEDESFIDNFWHSVDQAPSASNNSLEWMTKDNQIFPSTPTLSKSLDFMTEDIEFSRSTPTLSEETKPSLRKRSSLQTNQKEHVDDSHWPSTAEERHRLVLRCKREKSQDDCLSELLQISPNRIKIVHDLKAVHAISIEVDTETRDALFADNYELHRDYIRTPLIAREMFTVGDARKLQKGQTVSWGVEAVRARQVWDEYGVRGRGVKVCILDTGVDASHEDFEGVTMNGYQGNDSVSPWNEDLRGHGTHITGIIAASDNNIGTV